MSDITITQANNGYLVEQMEYDYDGNQLPTRMVFSVDDSVCGDGKNSVETFARMCYHLWDTIGMPTSRYSAFRFFAGAIPGDKLDVSDLKYDDYSIWLQNFAELFADVAAQRNQANDKEWEQANLSESGN